MKGTRFAIGLLTACLLTACGGGGGSGSTAGSNNGSTPPDNGGGSSIPTPATVQIGGTASKGVLSNAIVSAYAISNGSRAALLGQTRTNTSGQYQLTLSGHTGPVLLELTADTNTRMACDAPVGCGNGAVFGQTVMPTGLTLQSILPQVSGSVQAAITPYTHLATELARSRAGGLSADNISVALGQIADLFDLPPLTLTQPVDLTASSLGTNADAQRYAVLNAAIAQLAGSTAQLGPKLTALSNELISRNGQLLGHSDATTTIDLADVLGAAHDVASSSAVSSKLDTIVDITVLESFTRAMALGSDSTAANGGSTGSLPALPQVKAFVSHAHELVQSILQMDHADTLTQIEQKLGTLTLLQQQDHPDRELAKMGDALAGAHRLMLHLLAEYLASGTTTLDANAANTYFSQRYASPYRQLSAGAGFTASLDPTTRTVTVNGPLLVSLQKAVCCNGDLAPVGAELRFDIANLKLSYPDLTQNDTQFRFDITTGGSIDGTRLKLVLHPDESDSWLVMKFPATATLRSHLDAWRDNDTGTDAAHQPTQIGFLLSNAALVAKNAPDTDFSQFNGMLALFLNQVDLPMANGQPGSQTWPVPVVVATGGRFSAANGARLEAGITLALADDLANQAVVSPESGRLEQDASHYVHGDFQATLKLKLSATSTTETEVNVLGHRTSLNGGELIVTLRQNDGWLRLNANGTNLLTAPTLVLSNQDNVMLTLSPQQLQDDDASNDAIDLQLNGVTYGRLYQVSGGAWVVKFSDNTFTLL